MRSAVISDIHVDINKDYKVIEAISEYVHEHAIELILIAGDITNRVKDTIEVVAELERQSGAKVLYVPGNHDMWDEDKEYNNNDEIYQMFLEDEHCLCERYYETDKHIIVGDVGWYDYTFGNQEKYSEEEFDKMSIGGRTFLDYRYNTWAQMNKKHSDDFVEKLQKLIHEHPEKDIVVMTHVLSHEAFLVPEDIGDWSYLNAFLGSKKLKDLCLENKVRYAICGHVHYRKNVDEEKTTWLCRCLNYHNEWLGEKDVKIQVDETIEILDL